MAEQRPFRFRLPWLSAPTTTPRPTSQPRPSRPTPEVQARIQPTTTIAPQRPPFRPPGIAPAQPPPPQPQATQRTEPQPLPSVPGAPTEPQVAAQPTSPSRARPQTRAASVPPSPTHAASQSRAASVPASPSRTISQPQPAVQTAPQQLSPSRLASQRVDQTVSQPSSPPRRGTQMQTTTLEHSPSGKSEPRTQLTQETFQPPPVTPTPPLETPPTSKKPVSITVSATQQKPLRESVKEAPETEGKKAVEEQRREGKPDGQAQEELIKGAISKLLATAADSEAKAKAKELPGATFHGGQRQREKEDTSERKKTSISPDEEKIKTVRLAHPKTRIASSESHQKHVTSNGEQLSLHKEIKEDISKFVHKLGVGHTKQLTCEKPASIVTLAGENKGASMQIGSESAQKDRFIHIHRGYKSNPDDSTEATTDRDGSSKESRSKDPTTEEDEEQNAYINSNTQSINNSIVFESSVNERNAGVQLLLSNLLEPAKSNDKPMPLETHKADVNITPAEKLTYEPRVRRRCLRGLFLESSDSDPDNPEKPQRHGCRYNCGERGKEKKVL